MPIEAQLQDTPPAAAPEPATVGDHAAGAPRLDAIRLLDHRTRTTGVRESGAPPGRYLAVDGESGTVLIPLVRPITHIGRGLIADVRFEDPRVSRRHAIVAQRGDCVRVLDDRSANGTYVNGRRVTVADLHQGDVVGLGPVVVRYLEIASPFKMLIRQEGRVFSPAGGPGRAPLAA